MEESLKEATMRHSKKGIVTWLRDRTYELLKTKAKDTWECAGGDEFIVDEDNTRYVIGNGALYCGFFVISRKRVKEIDGIKLPENGNLHELY